MVEDYFHMVLLNIMLHVTNWIFSSMLALLCVFTIAYAGR